MKHGTRLEVMEAINKATIMLSRTDDLYTGYLRFVSYIAKKLNVPEFLTEVLTQEELDTLDKDFNIDLLKIETRDLLTESLEEFGVITKTNSFRYAKLIEKKLEEINNLNISTPMLAMIPRQSSRLMVSLYEKLGDKVIYSCIEPDILLYRIGIINKILFNIPAFNLNVDPDKHNINLQSSNWFYADKWNGIPVDKIEYID